VKFWFPGYTIGPVGVDEAEVGVVVELVEEIFEGVLETDSDSELDPAVELEEGPGVEVELGIELEDEPEEEPGVELEAELGLESTSSTLELDAEAGVVDETPEVGVATGVDEAPESAETSCLYNCKRMEPPQYVLSSPAQVREQVPGSSALVLPSRSESSQ
jgi:hypothetical protein